MLHFFVHCIKTWTFWVLNLFSIYTFFFYAIWNNTSFVKVEGSAWRRESEEAALTQTEAVQGQSCLFFAPGGGPDVALTLYNNAFKAGTLYSLVHCLLDVDIDFIVFMSFIDKGLGLKWEADICLKSNSCRFSAKFFFFPECGHLFKCQNKRESMVTDRFLLYGNVWLEKF